MRGLTMLAIQGIIYNHRRMYQTTLPPIQSSPAQQQSDIYPLTVGGFLTAATTFSCEPVARLPSALESFFD